MFMRSKTRLAIAVFAVTCLAWGSLALADFSDYYAPGNWTATYGPIDTWGVPPEPPYVPPIFAAGYLDATNAPTSLDFYVGNTDNWTEYAAGGNTFWTIRAPSAGTWSFDWSTSANDPNNADGSVHWGWVLNPSNMMAYGQPDNTLADATGQSGSASMTVNENDVIGFWARNTDNSGEVEYMRVSNFLGPPAGESTYLWKGQLAGDGQWTTAANWNNAMPGDGNVAVFSDTTAQKQAVDLGALGDVTVAGLTFNGNLNNIDITATDVSAPILILNGADSPAVVTVNGGAHTISAPIQLPDDGISSGTTTIDIAAAARLTLAGVVTTSGGMATSTSLVKQGPGILNVTGQLFNLADDSSTERNIWLNAGVVNLTNATVIATYMPVGHQSNAYVTATNSTVMLDGAVGNGFLVPGWDANTFSSYRMNGGTFTAVNFGGIVVGDSGNAEAVMTIENNAQLNFNLQSGFDLSGNGCKSGTVIMKSGEVHFDGSGGSVSSLYNLVVGAYHGVGVFNQLGGTVQGAKSVSLMWNSDDADFSNAGIYNLNGGTLAAGQIMSGGNGGGKRSNAVVNFHGGALKPTASNPDFITSSDLAANPNGISAANVYSEGAVIDTNGKDITIRTKLEAPAGKGVSNGTIVLSGNGKGAGYKGTPALYINGGGGKWATAIANMVDDLSGNGTFMIDSITITNPGVNYTTAPTLSISGGDPTSAAVLPALAIANNVSGGLIKNGLGTLTLTGALTYTGTTAINAGTLVLRNIPNAALSTIVGSGKLVVAGTTNLAATSITVGTLTIDGGPGPYAAVPEPGTLVLLALAGAALFGAYSRNT
jgi:autotransporter-associated beta strand protein